MYPEIAAAFPDYDFRMFDYTEVKPNGDTVVQSLDEQAKVLQQQIDSADGEIILLCPSQGSIIAGLVDLSRVSKVILLAPPETAAKKLAEWLHTRPGAKYNPDGVSVLPRTDGSTTYIPKEYLQSIQGKNPMEIYQKIADTKPTIIIRTTEDEAVGMTHVNEIKNAQHIDIATDHNFSGAARQELIDRLQQLL
jgi:hypothetical protein